MLLLGVTAFAIIFTALGDFSKLFTAVLAICSLALFEYPLPAAIVLLKRKDISVQTIAMAVAWIIKMVLLFALMFAVIKLNFADNLLYALILTIGSIAFLLLDVLVFMRHLHK
jgi:hypothetical protein